MYTVYYLGHLLQVVVDIWNGILHWDFMIVKCKL